MKAEEGGLSRFGALAGALTKLSDRYHMTMPGQGAQRHAMAQPSPSLLVQTSPSSAVLPYCYCVPLPGGYIILFIRTFLTLEGIAGVVWLAFDRATQQPGPTLLAASMLGPGSQTSISMKHPCHTHYSGRFHPRRRQVGVGGQVG